METPHSALIVLRFVLRIFSSRHCDPNRQTGTPTPGPKTGPAGWRTRFWPAQSGNKENWEFLKSRDTYPRDIAVPQARLPGKIHVCAQNPYLPEKTGSRCPSECGRLGTS